jgi:hypothetical protein
MAQTEKLGVVVSVRLTLEEMQQVLQLMEDAPYGGCTASAIVRHYFRKGLKHQNQGKSKDGN